MGGTSNNYAIFIHSLFLPIFSIIIPLIPWQEPAPQWGKSDMPLEEGTTQGSRPAPPSFKVTSGQNRSARDTRETSPRGYG
jgi:hypothetical protein